jgi:glycosyltransferase involved in cell wall biosynthesis
MRVWIITIGEPLPTDTGQQRLLRSGILAGALDAGGHEVTWWSSTFNHMLKVHRQSDAVEHQITPRLRLKLLHSVSYEHNISFKRILNHRGIARQFADMATSEPRPDVILCSYPTIENSDAATRFGAERGIPVVLDVRDQWPEVFLSLAPAGLRWAARLALWPLFQTGAKALRRATAVTGVTEKFVDWGVRYASRVRGPWDTSFPMAYPDTAPTSEAIAEAERFWNEQDVPGNYKFIACFFGTLGRQFELDAVIEAARNLRSEGVLFVLCGTGDRLNHYKNLAGDCPNVMFPGWMDAPQIWTLMRKASIGLAPYPSEANYADNMPNKPLEYLSAGLPIVSSLRGGLEQLLEHNCCGLTYRNKDAADLASKILVLKQDPGLLARMSDNAANTFRSHFKAEDVYGRMVAYLETIAAAGGYRAPTSSRGFTRDEGGSRH